MPRNQPNEKAIFNVARTINSPEARAAYLQQVCGDDPGLVDRIDALLHGLEKQESFLESPAVAAVSTLGFAAVTENPGTVIGPYKLLQEIGEGGFGVVYMAEQTQPVRRKIALKIIKPGMDTKEVIARFEAEQQALALMDHPNIAKVLDAGATISGRPYFVMELVKGVPLTEYCDKNHLSAKERLKLFVSVCHAIQHAHQKGIIHRDLKPSNIMVTLHEGKPVPKVIDFGVSKALSQQLTAKTLFTAYGQMVGTPAYMSPEQAEMSGMDIDIRSDVYSLGVLLYELLTGGTPFDAKRLRSAGYAEMQRIIREEDPPKPSTRLTTIGEKSLIVSTNRSTDPKKLGRFIRGDLDWIVMKAMDKDRNCRYETANSFATEIERFLNDEPVEACPPSATYRLRKFARRNKALFITTATVLVVLVLATVASTWQAIRATRAEASAKVARQREGMERRKAERERNEAETERQRASQLQRLAEQREETNRWSLYAAQMTLADHAWENRQVDRMIDLLASQRPERGQPDLRGFEWHYLWNQCHSPHRVLRESNGNLYHVAFSFDGKILAAGGSGGDIKLYNPATGQEQAQFSWPGAAVTAIAFSPDGRTLAAAGSVARGGQRTGRIKLWNVVERREQVEFGPEGLQVSCLAFAPDGKTLASGEASSLSSFPARGQITIWDAVSGEERFRFDEKMKAISCVTFSPNGASLATTAGARNSFAASGASGTGELRIWDLKGRTLRSRLEFGQSPLSSVTFSPDGELLAVGGGPIGKPQGQVKLVDLMGTEVGSFNVGQGVVWSLAFSSTGETLAVGCGDGTVNLVDLSARTVIATRWHRSVTSVAFASDGATLASAGGREIRLWKTRSLLNRAVLGRHNGGATAVRFSPDGRALASVGYDGKVRIWENVGRERTTHNRPRANLKQRAHDAGRILALDYSPDGNHLATGGDRLTLWDANRETEILDLTGHSASVMAVAFAPDVGSLASADAYGDVKIWDASSGEQINSFQTAPVSGHDEKFLHGWHGGASYVTSLAFSRDGKKLVVGGLKGVAIWDPLSGQRLSGPKGDTRGHMHAALSPHSGILATAKGQTIGLGAIGGSTTGNIVLWDLAQGEKLRDIPTYGFTVTCLRFAHDGKTLAGGGIHGNIRLWSVATGQELATLRGHSAMVFDIGFSPDDELLASASADHTVRLWTAANVSAVQTP